MDYSVISVDRLSEHSRRIRAKLPPNPFGSGLFLYLGVAAVALVLGAAVAYLVVQGDWMLGLVVLAVIPGAILLHNHPILGLAAWLMVTPFLVSSTGGSIRQVYWLLHRGLPLIMVVVVVVSAALGVKKRPLPKLGAIEVAMFFYIVVSLASIALLGEDPAATAIHFYDRVIVPILLYLLVRLLAPNEEDLRFLLPVILFICLSQSAIGFIYVFARGALPSSWLSTDGVRATGSLGSESVYSTTVLFAAALVLHLGLSRPRWDLPKLLLVTSFGMAMLAVFFSFSRAGWLAMAFVLVGFAFLYPRFVARASLVAIPLIVLFGAVVLGSQLDYASNRLYSERSEESALSRLPVILASLRMFEEQPVFGWGYGNFDRYDREFQGAVSGLFVPDKDHASHNLYLTILAEQGLVGILLYLAPMLIMIPPSIKRWKTLPADGLWSKKLLVILWMLLGTHVIVNNFSNMRVVFGLGLWWITLALIGVMVFGPDRQQEIQSAE